MIKLIQRIKFFTSTKTRNATQNIAIIRFPKRIKARTNENWSNAAIIIPPTCPTSFEASRLIEIKYIVLLKIILSGATKLSKITLSIPITIGTIPIINDASSIKHECTYEPFSAEPCLTEMPSNKDFKGEFIESDMNCFKPLYPFYKDISCII
jgi:hypothetical protein